MPRLGFSPSGCSEPCQHRGSVLDFDFDVFEVMFDIAGEDYHRLL